MYLQHIIDFLSKTNEIDTAKVLLDTFAKYANSIEQYDELGMLYEKIKAYSSSVKMLERCLATARNSQELFTIRANMSKVYNHLNDPQTSLLYSRLNILVQPDDYESYMEQSFSYYLLGDYDKSYEIQKDLLSKPDCSEEIKKRIAYNMGTFELSNGSFKAGIYKMITVGKEIGIWPPIEKPFEKWNGESTDKPILIFAEAGIGDEIINVRFVNTMLARGLKPYWVSLRPEINQLFKDCDIPTINYADIDMSISYLYCEAITLPILLDISEDTVWQGPYLYAEQAYIDKWKKILPENFIAVKYSGNPFYDQDLHRSIDSELLVSSLSKLGLPLVSLHVEDKIDDNRLQSVRIESWKDTLAIQSLAKTTVTSCTSTAHSAGAAGFPCIVLPPIAKYYPWLTMRNDTVSYWYADTLRVFPQTEHKNWQQPINKAVAYIEQMQ